MAKEETEFDKSFDESMNKDGFAKFLVDSGNTEIHEEPEMEKGMETFDSFGEVTREIKALYIDKLKQDLGIELDAKDFDAIDAHLYNMAITDSEKLLDLNKKVDKHNGLKEEISGLETKLGQTEKKSKRAGMFGKMFGFIKTQTFELRKSFKEGGSSDIRIELFDEVREIKGIHDQVKSLVAKEMKRLLGRGGRTVEELSDLQAKFENLKDVEAKGEMGDDILEELNPDEFQKKLDEAMEKKVNQEIEGAIEKVKLGEGTLSRMEDVLSSYLEMNKAGSKEDDDARFLIIKSIEDSISKLPTDTDGQAKRLILLRVVQKAERNYLHN
jgi:hypothetical protein